MTRQLLHRSFGRWAGWPGRLRRCESGVSAVEFGLLAPMIFFSFLAMVDVGLAINERMYVDQVLRSGGQPAMRDHGETTVRTVLQRAVCKSGETFPSCAQISEMTFSADRYCVCPTTGVRDTTCTSTCAIKPRKYYELSATRSYEGIFLPRMDFAPSVTVEVR